MEEARGAVTTPPAGMPAPWPMGPLMQAVWKPEDLQAGYEVATFAGGCFWSVQLAFDRLHGVVSSAVGYAQGQKEHPTYSEVLSMACKLATDYLLERWAGTTHESEDRAPSVLRPGCMAHLQVCTGTTGHSEAVQLVYDPEQISYAHLLDALFESKAVIALGIW